MTFSVPTANPIYPDGAVVMAPLSGYTDLPFRRACRRQGCFFAFTPLIEVGSIVYRNPRAPALLLRGPDEPWLGVQILGADLGRLRQAVDQLNDYDFDLLDFNMGCPVPKVTRRGAGAAMGRTPEFAAECLAAIVERSRFPVTGKIRILDHHDPAPTVAFARLLEAAGCQALTIHGRLWERIYSGPVATPVLAAVRQALAIPVVANGGVMDADSANRLRQATGCSRLMVARGAIGNPWLFEEIAGAPPPSPAAVADELARHFGEMVDFYGQDVGLRLGRKIISAYLAGRGYPHELRAEVMKLRGWDDFLGWLARLRIAGPTPNAPSR